MAINKFFTSILLAAAAQSALTLAAPAPSDSAKATTKHSTQKDTSSHTPTSTGKSTPTATGKATVVTPSSVADGYYTLPAGPASCSGSVIPLKTSIPMVGKQISVWDSSPKPFWYFNTPAQTFTFSTNTSGIAFGNPFWDQGNPPSVFPRQHGNSFTMNMSAATGDGQLMFMAYSSNTTQMPDASVWNASTPYHETPDGPKPFFVLDIEGSAPCANPLPAHQSCASGTLELNKANWLAYGVDEWFGDWVKSAGPFSNSSSMMTKFLSQFMNNNCAACVYDKSCLCAGSCANLSNGGKGSDAEKIWLAWAAISNLSDMLSNIWESIMVADPIALGNIGNIGLDFIDQTIAVTQGTAPEDQISKANHILGALSPWLNFIAPFLFPEADIGIKIFSTAMGFTSAMLTLEDKPGSAPIQAQTEGLNTLLKAQGGLTNYVTGLISSVETVHNQIFTSGVNITDYLSGGAFVNRTLLGLDCDSCKAESQAWTMQYLSMKTMNYVWWVQNVFISYVPYGTIISNSDGKQTQFTEDICAGVFLKDDPDLVWCHTDDAVAGTGMKPGMARLTYYDKLASGNSPTHPNPTEAELNSHSNGNLNMTTAAPGYKSQMQFKTTASDVQWTFNKTQVMASSLAGYAKYGFQGDGMSGMTDSLRYATQTQNLNDTISAYKDLFAISATSPGMFTLPVCVSYNLNYWPTIYGTSGKPQGDQWCVCNSPWSVDKNGNKFNSTTPPDLTTLVSQAYQISGQQMVCGPGIWGSKAPGLEQDQMSPTIGTGSW